MPKIDFSRVDDYNGIPEQEKRNKDDYEAIAEAFLVRRENEKKAIKNKASKNKDIFLKVIYTFRMNRVVRRKELADIVGCSGETISQIARLLKRFKLISSTDEGYVRKRKFYMFLKSFLREHPEFYKTEEGNSLSTMYENVVRFSR